MKYEAVFGNQELFDGAGTFTGLDVVVHSIASGIKSYARLSDLTPESLRNHPVCAMRRIIKEPKRWTWEDKKAGRLPDVGCRAIWRNDNGMECTVKIETAFFGNECAVSIDDEVIYFAENFCLFPIETPSEKAQREEDEFVDALVSEYNKMPSSTSFKAGIRAAYRKLKGGE